MPDGNLAAVKMAPQGAEHPVLAAPVANADGNEKAAVRQQDLLRTTADKRAAAAEFRPDEAPSRGPLTVRIPDAVDGAALIRVVALPRTEIAMGVKEFVVPVEDVVADGEDFSGCGVKVRDDVADALCRRGLLQLSPRSAEQVTSTGPK